MAREELEHLASELGVTIKTLAQYADAAGHYRPSNSSHNTHHTPHKRMLPPRGSVEGHVMADRIRRAAGSNKVRSVVNRKPDLH